MKFSIYLNRHVFVMEIHEVNAEIPFTPSYLELCYCLIMKLRLEIIPRSYKIIRARNYYKLYHSVVVQLINPF